MRHWVYLGLAILAEVLGTCFMKWGSDHGQPAGLLAMFVLLGLSYYALSLAVRQVPVGVAYAIWEGVGIVCITGVSLMLFGEHMSGSKAAGMLAVLAGIVLLKHGVRSQKRPPMLAVTAG